MRSVSEFLFKLAIAGLFCFAAAPSLRANPKGLVVGHGHATAAANGSTLTINATSGAVLNWSSFNIGLGETTTFVQPNTHSVVWNNIHDANPSQILGSLNANGFVVLYNSHGFYFGDQSVITAGGFMAVATPVVRSTAPGGPFWQYDGAPPAASIINYGAINIGPGGSAYLVANAVENHGSITADDGRIGLFAGKSVLISERPDGRGLSAAVKLPAGSVDNSGKLIADSGTIALRADVVNQDGLVQADSALNDNGVIELIASDGVHLGSSSSLSATGDAGVSAGGKVVIKGGATFTDDPASVIDVAGGGAGGNAGKVILCANSIAAIDSHLIASAQRGWKGGGLFIDPTSITLNTSGTGKVGTGGTVLYNTAGALTLNVNSAFTGFSAIDLQTSGNITLGTSTTWNLATSTGVAAGTLTLEAGGNIIFNNNSKLIASSTWKVLIAAGRDFSVVLAAAPTNPQQVPSLGGIKSGTGGIYLNGSTTVSTLNNGTLTGADGSLDLRAGKEVVLGTGGLTTASDGSLSIVTGTGDVDLNSTAAVGGGTFAVTAGNNINANSSIAATYVNWNAGQDIGINGSWTLPASAGSTLGLYAGRNINFTGSSAQINAGKGWTAQLVAGRDFTKALAALPTAPHTAPGLDGLKSGVGGIYFNGGAATSSGTPQGGGSLQIADGNLDLRAGNEVVLGSGAVGTTAGGNLSVVTGTGDISIVGNGQAGYSVYNTGLNYNGVSGFATEFGGNVVMNAGGNINCLEQSVYCFGIGCWGAGNMNLTAGKTILGKFLVANGDGTLTAHQIGAPAVGKNPANGVSLGLTKGSWNLTSVYGAGNNLGDIYLNEVFNPSGVLNFLKQTAPSGAKVAYLYNYDTSDSVSLTAGNSVEFIGNNLVGAALGGSGPPARPAIYPSMLTVNAGAGGVNLDNDVVLAPSATAELSITTTHGGNLQGLPRAHNNAPVALVMSDSDSLNFADFESGHSASPLQLSGAATPITLNISGNLQYIGLQFPKRSVIKVGGNAVDYFFTGQNLLPGDVSQFNVAGDIIFDTVSVAAPLPKKPNFSIFNLGTTSDPNLGIAGSLGYDAANHQLDFNNVMSAAQYAFLLDPTVLIYDRFGQVETNPDGTPKLKHVTFAPASVITQLYQESQLKPFIDVTGIAMTCGGPGQFDITARNMNLGISGGIRSVTGGLNPALAGLFASGPDLDVTLDGNLSMVSSMIASFGGGSIDINAGGSVDIGGQALFTSDSTPRGIYTAHGGDISVTAVGDIDIDGSRIATYDGGNIKIDSKTGSVNAGGGGGGEFSITTLQRNPKTGVVANVTDTFFGAGIVTMTPVHSSVTVGNILVDAGLDISTGGGGILQLARNLTPTTTLPSVLASLNATAVFNAGRDIIAKHAGILARNVTAKAGRDIIGLIVTLGNSVIHATGLVDVQLVSVGSASISSDTSVTGNIVAGGDVSVSATSISGSVASTAGSTSTTGDASAAKVGTFTGTVVQTVAKTTQDASEVAQQSIQMDVGEQQIDADKKRPSLSKPTGRVRLLLPSKIN